VELDLARQAPFADHDLVRQLVTVAIDAARQRGASYADARVTRTVTQQIIGLDTTRNSQLLDVEEHAIGVRAMIDGRWGFAASALWTPNDAANVARVAADQAHINAAFGPRAIEWGTYPVASGTWTMPVGIDPFMISFEEKIDFVDGWMEALRHISRNVATSYGQVLSFRRQERAVGTTDGAYFTQTVYDSSATFGTQLMQPSMHDGIAVPLRPRGLDRQGAGWDALVNAKPIEQIPALLDEAYPLLKGGSKPVDNGRYTAVLDATSAARLLGSTIGLATELDRALGDEANATGTSYLGPKPLDLLGTFAAGSPALTVTANRSLRGGLATVKWDDEGVTPDEFTVVKDGIVVDYQTTREQAGWLAPWYRKRGIPVRSHGCAGAASALSPVIQCTPNLALTPAAGTTGMADMIAGVKKGVAIFDCHFETDFQARNGYGYGVMREIVDGKIGAMLDHAWLQFSAVEIWKNLRAVGGTPHVETVGLSHDKGEPTQTTSFSISAPPITVTNLTLVNEQGRLT
jgi:TldD protein